MSKKNFFKLLIIVINSSIFLNCFALEMIGSYGIGFSSNSFNSGIKAFHVYLRDNLNEIFFQQGTLLYLQDHSSVKENDSYYTLGAFYGFGALFKLKFIELSASLSIGGISHPDNIYLDARFPQFNEVAMISLIDDTSIKTVGFSYSHISSAGLVGTENQGRDLVSIIIGYKF